MTASESDVPKALPRKLSDEQRQLTEWFAVRERVEIPPAVLEDGRKWWPWINSLIRRFHRDLAREMQIDFGISVDYGDPVSIIGAVKYAATVRMNEAARTREDDHRDAAAAMAGGEDAWSVADRYELTETELVAIVGQVEARGADVRGYY